MKLTFFTDLDNTLIHSHRHKLSEPHSCVELLNGKRQSFVLDSLIQYLNKQDWLKIVPLTMRTLAQYKRLSLLAQSLQLRDALICNGAILLNKFENNIRWEEDSYRLAVPYLDQLTSLEKNATVSDFPFVFYIVTDHTEETYVKLSELTDRQLLLFKDSRKVYFLPASNNKGNAVKRYLHWNSGLSISMGDSEPDLSMLNESDYAICPHSLYDSVRPRRQKYLCDLRSSNQIISALNSIKKEVFGCD